MDQGPSTHIADVPSTQVLVERLSIHEHFTDVDSLTHTPAVEWLIEDFVIVEGCIQVGHLVCVPAINVLQGMDQQGKREAERLLAIADEKNLKEECAEREVERTQERVERQPDSRGSKAINQQGMNRWWRPTGYEGGGRLL